MGWELATLEINATLDKHGGVKQVRDKELWQELLKRIEEVVKDPKFETIRPMVV